jgi:FtsP/CotA-like multicopper oxidase with cupredoxin domain
MQMTRRQFLTTTTGAALGAVLPLGSLARAAGSDGKAAVKTYHFTAAKARVNLGDGPDFIAWTYNGKVPGPEIRVTEGDIIRVVLKNDLPSGTTIHWHGIPLKNAMDGVPGITQPSVKPGETFVYEFKARPSGSFLYHSHAGYQLDQGLYGPLIIEPRRPETDYDREYTLVLEDWVMKDGGGTAATQRRPPMGMGMMRGRGQRFQDSTESPLWEPVYDAYAVNGRVPPLIEPLTVVRGERVKLRLVNASSATLYYLRLAGHTLTVTHSDGNPVRPVETDVLPIGMGERCDVVFNADNPGSWLLAAGETGYGEGRLQVPVLYRGVHRSAPELPSFHRGLRLVSYSDMETLHPIENPPGGAERIFDQELSGGMHSDRWAINGQVYPDADPLMVSRGQRIRLRYGNRSMMPHPMHLHGHFFRIVNPRLPRERWLLKDTLIVDHMQRFDVEFIADNPGRWFHHCHNLYHMEAGMANVVVYDEAVQSLTF